MSRFPLLETAPAPDLESLPDVSSEWTVAVELLLGKLQTSHVDCAQVQPEGVATPCSNLQDP